MKIEFIASPQNPRFKEGLRLHSSRGRQKSEHILILGRREEERAVLAGLLLKDLMIDDSATDSSSVDWLRQVQQSQPSIRISRLSHDLFSKLAYGDRDAELVAIAPRPKTNLKQMDCLFSPNRPRAVILVIESLEKPGNLGAIARTADAMAIGAIFVADPLTDIFHPNAVRASLGTVFSVPIACASSAEIRHWLTVNDFKAFIATPDAKRKLFEVDLNGRIAIVIGNEAKGLSPEWRNGTGTGICLPMLGIGDSLNASITASLMMYEATRQSLGRSTED